MDDFGDVLALWIDAERRGDTAALDAVLDRQFRGDGAEGRVLDKQEWLDRHRSGELSLDALQWPHTHVRVHGTVAVAMGIQTQTGRYRGHDCTGQFWVTLIAIRRHDPERWSIVNLQRRALLDPLPVLRIGGEPVG